MKKLFLVITAMLALIGSSVASEPNTGPVKPPVKFTTTYAKPQTNPAQPFQWQGAFILDLKSKGIDAVVINNVYPLTLHGKFTGISIGAFAGTTLDSGGHSITGVLALWNRQLFDQIGISFGAGGAFQGGTGANSGFRVVIEAGATIKF